MGKIADFFSKWAFAIVLCLIALALACACGCSMFVAVEHPFVGIVGTIGAVIALMCVGGWIIVEIKEG
jgi:hypothetical protein